MPWQALRHSSGTVLANSGARRLGLVLDRWYPTSAPTFETAMDVDVHPRLVLGVDGRVALVRDAGPAFGPGFAAVLLRQGLGDLGAAMTAH